MEPHELEILPEALFREPPPLDDSSEDEDSSGDESVDVPPQAPVPRRLRDPAMQAERDAVLSERVQNAQNAQNARQQGPKPKRFDVLLLEFVPGGDFETLIRKLSEANNGQMTALMIPNRVLWSIWLCCKFQHGACDISICLWVSCLTCIPNA